MEFTTIPNTLRFTGLRAFTARDIRISPKEGKHTGLFKNTDLKRWVPGALLSAMQVAEWVSGLLSLPVLHLQRPTRGMSDLPVITPGLLSLQLK